MNQNRNIYSKDHIVDFKKIPKPPKIPTAYFIVPSLTNSNEKIIFPEEQIPFEIELLNRNKMVHFNKENHTIHFIKKGKYRIDFIVQASTIPQYQNEIGNNILSLGFLNLSESKIYAGNSVWITSNEPILIIGQGYINITEPVCCKLINTGKYPIYLQRPKISSFYDALASLMIQKIE